MHWKIEKLEKGESFITKEKGNSMIPLLYSNQEHELSPIKLEDVKVDDIVFVKVKGKLYTHLVKAIDPKKGVLIGNNKGNINGWSKNVYGKVTKILNIKK